MYPVIFHIDMNNFYASVELLEHPELRHLPVVVGGDPEARHGVVLAKNNVAKKLGIKTAETLYAAQQRVPNLIVLKPHRDRYHIASQKALSIYLEYTEFVEAFSLDEAWLDVTQHPKLKRITPGQLAFEIKERIKHEMNLTVSIGVSWNKTFAKLGSDYKKPDAVTVIDQTNYQKLLYPLPIERMLFVGPSAAKTLRRANLTTIGDLANVEPMVLSSLLGRHGDYLYQRVHGLDREPVRRFVDKPQPKSLSNFRTLSSDVTDPAKLRAILSEIAAELSDELKAKNLRAETLQLNLRWIDFSQISRQQSLPRPSQEFTTIRNCAYKILAERIDLVKPVRALGLTLSKLQSSSEPIQMTLLDLHPRKDAKTTEATTVSTTVSTTRTIENDKQNIKKEESSISELLASLPEPLRYHLKSARDLEKPKD